MNDKLKGVAAKKNIEKLVYYAYAFFYYSIHSEVHIVIFVVLFLYIYI